MSLPCSVLPSDPDELRAFATALQAEYTSVKAALEAEIYAQTLHIEKLKKPARGIAARAVRQVFRKAGP
jgi:hypothetical protein